MSSRLTDNKVAARYARALFEAAADSGKLDEVVADLNAVQDLFKALPELSRFLENPSIPGHEKIDFAKSQLIPKVNAWVGNLLGLMIQNKRITAFPALIDQLADLINKRDNIAKAEAITAAELDNAQLDKLRQALESRYGFSKVLLSNRVEPSILGGVIVKLQDQVIDGSFSGRLESLRKQLV